MVKRAIIIENTGNEAVLGLLPDDCKESSSCHECGMCSASGSKNELVMIRVKSDADMGIGDLVEVDVSAPSRSVIALLIYLMPLILMFAGGFAGNELCDETGLVAGGFTGLLVSVLLIYIMNRTVLRLKGKIIKRI